MPRNRDAQQHNERVYACTEKARVRARRFNNSERGKAIHKKYAQSPKGRAQQARYRLTARRKLASAKYQASAKGHAAQARYTQKPHNREHKRQMQSQRRQRTVFVAGVTLGRMDTPAQAAAIQAHARARYRTWKESQCESEPRFSTGAEIESDPTGAMALEATAGND